MSESQQTKKKPKVDPGFLVAMLSIVYLVICFLVLFIALGGRAKHKDDEESKKYKTWNEVMKNSGYAILAYIVACGMIGAGAAMSLFS
jgi:ABC-type phosphate transport system permease subunit